MTLNIIYTSFHAGDCTLQTSNNFQIKLCAPMYFSRIFQQVFLYSSRVLGVVHLVGLVVDWLGLLEGLLSSFQLSGRWGKYVCGDVHLVGGRTKREGCHNTDMGWERSNFYICERSCWILKFQLWESRLQIKKKDPFSESLWLLVYSSTAMNKCNLHKAFMNKLNQWQIQDSKMRWGGWSTNMSN